MKKIATSGLMLFLITLLGSELRGMAVVKTVDQPSQSSPSTWVDVYRQFTFSRNLRMENDELVLAFVLRDKITGLARQRLYKFETVEPLFKVFHKPENVNVRVAGYSQSWAEDSQVLDEIKFCMGRYFEHMMGKFFHLGRALFGWDATSISRIITEHLASVDLNQGDVSYDLNIHDASSFRQQEAVNVNAIETPQEIIEKLSKALPSTVLGISAEAGEAEAKKAFRKLSLKFHPDKWPDQKEIATEAFNIIGAARDAFVEKDFSRYENLIREITATDVRQECRPSASKVKYKIVQ